jgi:hypothetical protein
MRLFELFTKETTPVLVEGIEHPEDSIITSGSAGAERVFKELLGLEKDTKTVSVKWDGFPAVVFGRDDQGNIVFVDKHMYDKVAKGKMEFMTIKDYDEERGVNRSNLWKTEEILRPILNRIVPNVKNSFYMGDLMWTGTPNTKDGAYVFRPNTVEYKVKIDSELGNTIAKSVGGIAVHTYIPGLGAADQPLVGLKGLPEDGGITFLVGEIKNKPKVTVDKNLVKETQAAINQHKDVVDKFIQDLTAMKSKSVLTAMSPFITSMLADGDIVSNIVPRFLEFLKSKLSDSAAAKMLGDNNNGWLYQQDGGAPGLLGIWTIWAAITDLKIHIKKQVDGQLQGSEVQAVIDGEDSHEGYVFGAGKDKLKLVDRLGFTRAHFGKFKVPDEEIKQKQSMPLAVFCFGRMNPPTLGHKAVMAKTVQAGGQNAYIFLSNTHNNDTDPLDPAIKADFIKKIYPTFAKHIVSDYVINPIEAANWLYAKGFRNIAFVAGSDRLGNAKGSIEKLLTSWNSGPIRTTDYARGENGREHVHLQFISSGERDADTTQVSGISGTLARNYAKAGDEENFQKATGVGPNIVVKGMTLYQATRAGMGLGAEPTDPTPGKKVAAKPPVGKKL